MKTDCIFQNRRQFRLQLWIVGLSLLHAFRPSNAAHRNWFSSIILKGMRQDCAFAAAKHPSLAWRVICFRRAVGMYKLAVLEEIPEGGWAGTKTNRFFGVVTKKGKREKRIVLPERGSKNGNGMFYLFCLFFFSPLMMDCSHPLFFLSYMVSVPGCLLFLRFGMSYRFRAVDGLTSRMAILSQCLLLCWACDGGKREEENVPCVGLLCFWFFLALELLASLCWWCDPDVCIFASSNSSI